jgi:hypothetical protein
MKKCGTAAVDCSIEEQARAPAPHFHKAFQGKPTIHFARGSYCSGEETCATEFEFLVFLDKNLL